MRREHHIPRTERARIKYWTSQINNFGIDVECGFEARAHPVDIDLLEHGQGAVGVIFDASRGEQNLVSAVHVHPVNFHRILGIVKWTDFDRFLHRLRGINARRD